MAETFELRPHFEWRGLGFISQSALKIHADYADYDAELRYDMPGVRVAESNADGASASERTAPTVGCSRPCRTRRSRAMSC